MASALLAFEVTSVLRRLVYLGELTVDEGERAFERFRRMRIRYTHRQAIFPVAWQLAKDYNRPHAYDTSYVAVAQLHDCQFWTGDRRLYNSVAEGIESVRSIGEYVPNSSLRPDVKESYLRKSTTTLCGSNPHNLSGPLEMLPCHWRHRCIEMHPTFAHEENAPCCDDENGDAYDTSRFRLTQSRQDAKTR